MSTAIDITGQRFARLTAIKRIANGKDRKARWLCRCDCGGQNKVAATDLRKGRIRSCGCLRRETAVAIGSVTGAANGRASLSVHSHSQHATQSPTYRSWIAMKCRCTNRKHKSYHNYGGRGIRVCERWLNSFENFLADMGERPPGRTLDRYPDPDGNYEPGNCRWATPTQQRANQREKRSVT